MNPWAVMFGKIISIYVGVLTPLNIQYGARCLIPELVIAHVPGFAAFVWHRGMHKGICHFVIHLDARQSLCVTNGFQCTLNPQGYLGVVEEATTFCLCGRAHNIL